METRGMELVESADRTIAADNVRKAQQSLVRTVAFLRRALAHSQNVRGLGRDLDEALEALRNQDANLARIQITYRSGFPRR